MSGVTTERARTLIGVGADDDYVIQPSAHAARYAAAAPELGELLLSSAVEVSARSYEQKDAAALAAQGQFTSASRRARGGVFASGVAAALVLAAGGLAPLLPGRVSSPLLVAFALLAVAAGGLASYWIRRIRDGHLLERWMTRRAEAETERLRYFELVTKEQATGEPLLQLEYFRRYQHDSQRAYYRTRAAQHEQAGDRALSLSSAGLAAAGIASGAAGVLGATIHPSAAVLAGAALVAQAWASAVENGEAISQHRRNAERFTRTLTALDALRGRLDQVRNAVAAGELDALHAYVDAVHEQLSLEHRQWQEDTTGAVHAVRQLDALLGSYRERTPPMPA